MISEPGNLALLKKQLRDLVGRVLFEAVPRHPGKVLRPRIRRKVSALFKAHHHISIETEEVYAYVSLTREVLGDGIIDCVAPLMPTVMRGPASSLFCVNADVWADAFDMLNREGEHALIDWVKDNKTDADDDLRTKLLRPLARAVREYHQHKDEEKAFERLWGGLQREMSKPTETVRIIVPIFRVRLRDGGEHRIADFSLHNADEADLSTLATHIYNEFRDVAQVTDFPEINHRGLPVRLQLDKIGCIATCDREWPRTPVQDDAHHVDTSVARDLQLYLRLYGVSRAVAPITFWIPRSDFTQMVPTWETHSSFASLAEKSSEEALRLSFKGGMFDLIDSNVVQDLQENWASLERWRCDDKVRMAAQRFEWSFEKERPEDVILDCWSALEALLVDGASSLTYKLAMRVARLIGSDEAERRKLYEELPDLYQLRSRIAHGQYLRKGDGPWTEVERIRDIARRAILEAILRGPRFSASALDYEMLGIATENSDGAAVVR